MRTDELITLMERDKKTRCGLTFVLDGRSGPELVADVPVQVVVEVLSDMAGG